MRPILYDNRLALALAADLLVDLGHLDLFEQEAVHPHSRERYFSVILDGDIPALIYLGGVRCDEWKIAVSFWPGVDTRDHIHVYNAVMRRGEAYFYGWLNRWQFHGRAFGIEMFHDSMPYVPLERRARVAAIEIPSAGVAAELMRAYPRPLPTGRLPAVH